MQSKLTIEVDFDKNNQPVIQIIHRQSDDVRDKLVTSFLQSFGHSSNWASVEWVQNHIVDNKTLFQRILIRPIPQLQFAEVAQEMSSRILPTALSESR